MASLDLSKDDSLYTADFEAVPPSPTDAKSSPSDPHAEQNAEDFADIDSGHEVDIASSTESIESSHYLFEKRNGRTYHSYKSEHNYVLPNDALEQDRLDMQFWGIHEILEKYIFAPIGDTPQAILDVGTGTGLWAMDVGDLYPSAQIIGTDLSPIQPAWVPPNVQFELHDCTQYPWDFRRKFDLIHTQLINAFAVKNWRQFYTEAYDNLTPGGWIESHEFDLMVQSDDDSIPKPSAVIKWLEDWDSGAGGGFRISGERLAEDMESAGFINVVLKEFQLPIGRWRKDKANAGLLNLACMTEHIEGLSNRIFMERLGMTREQMDAATTPVVREFRNKNIHAYWPM